MKGPSDMRLAGSGWGMERLGLVGCLYWLGLEVTATRKVRPVEVRENEACQQTALGTNRKAVATSLLQTEAAIVRLYLPSIGAPTSHIRKA